MAPPNVIIVTKEDDALNHTINLAHMALCTHEEAETQILVHAKHVAEEGRKVSDTDILVIEVSVLPTLHVCSEAVVVAFDQRRTTKWIPVHLFFVLEMTRGILIF